MSKATTEQQLCGVIKLPEPAIDASVLDADRKMLMLEALWETEVLVDLLLEKASQEWGLENGVAMTIRGLGVRILTLNSVAMSALDDPIAETADLRIKVHGRVCAANGALGSDGRA